jgi:hypothetical protein
MSLREYVEKFRGAGQTTDESMAHSDDKLDT